MIDQIPHALVPIMESLDNLVFSEIENERRKIQTKQKIIEKHWYNILFEREGPADFKSFEAKNDDLTVKFTYLDISKRKGYATTTHEHPSLHELSITFNSLKLDDKSYDIIMSKVREDHRKYEFVTQRKIPFPEISKNMAMYFTDKLSSDELHPNLAKGIFSVYSDLGIDNFDAYKRFLDEHPQFHRAFSPHSCQNVREIKKVLYKTTLDAINKATKGDCTERLHLLTERYHAGHLKHNFDIKHSSEDDSKWERLGGAINLEDFDHIGLLY